MQDERINNKILYAMIVVLYISILVVVAFKYINTNRYWKIDGYDTNITAESGQDILIKARIKNKMYYVMGSDDQYFLSYHIYDETGNLIQFENPRTYLEGIEPGSTENIDLQIKALMGKGKYRIVIDVVKEGGYWFAEKGESPGVLYLTVD